jgi:hypothetical protein
MGKSKTTSRKKRITPEMHSPDSRCCPCLPVVLILALSACCVRAESIASQAPIHYDTAKSTDPIARLQKQIDAGNLQLHHDDRHGYLDAVLKLLVIPTSSQTLVFSKTSFQRDLIAPWKPRALYFNSDVYVGWVQGGEVLEIAAIDKQLGPVFYTLNQLDNAKPQFTRHTDACLQCHEGANTSNLPGLMVRSVYPDASGMPMFSAGSFHTTDASPFNERFGGWYVTGQHGSLRHMGNLVLRKKDDPDHLDLDRGANMSDLSSRLDPSAYLAPGSDIVALMVLTHQTQLHNLITGANYETRLALRDQKAMNEALHEKPDHVFESTPRRIKGACEPLVRAMLFCDEAKLTDAITGSSDFTRQFVDAGIKDRAGRSLRDFDLHTRLFKYPCSFLIYTDSYAALPAPAKEYIYQRLWNILTDKEAGIEFTHLSQTDRKAIREILAATMDGLPAYWK